MTAQALSSLAARAWMAWDRFWFTPQDPLRMGIFRSLVGLSLLVMYIVRHADLEFLLTDQGPIKASFAAEIVPQFYRSPLLWFPETDGLVRAWHWGLLGCLALLTAGLGGRLLTLATLFLHLGLLQRNPTIIYGADAVGTFWLVYLALTSSHSGFGLASWLKRRLNRGGVHARGRPEGAVSAAFSSVGVRLVQIQLCIIYAYSGLEKLKGGTWWDGSAVWAVLGNQNIMVWNLEFLESVPSLIALATFSTVLFEIYFPALIWLRHFRAPMLLFGFAMHLGIAVLMGIPFFSMLMLASYVFFVRPERLRGLFAPTGGR